jgi:hypothetical protein
MQEFSGIFQVNPLKLKAPLYAKERRWYSNLQKDSFQVYL